MPFPPPQNRLANARATAVKHQSKPPPRRSKFIIVLDMNISASIFSLTRVSPNGLRSSRGLAQRVQAFLGHRGNVASQDLNDSHGQTGGSRGERPHASAGVSGATFERILEGQRCHARGVSSRVLVG